MSIQDIAPEIDALRMGMDWDIDDITAPQVLVESTYGDSHPGSNHLDTIVEMVSDGLKYHRIKPAKFYATDMCDGIAQGHEGMNYSLASREAIAAMVEIHAMANHFDGMVVSSSCDKAVPGHLMAMARLEIPSIFVPGGVMPQGNSGLTLEQIGSISSQVKQGKESTSHLQLCQQDACPASGACQFMGTAATMQVMAEALGLALPHSALMPATGTAIKNMAKRAGKQMKQLLAQGITPGQILTKEAFENAIIIHGAIGGSTNALLHLPAIAHELGLNFDPMDVDRIHREVPFLVNTRPVGKYSTDLFWYAGGVPEIMHRLKDKLNLDVMTVTGKTLGENLAELAGDSSYQQVKGYLANYKLTQDDIIFPIMKHGAIGILTGNIAEEGAVVKVIGMDKAMHHFEGPARVFTNELDAREAILQGVVQPGDAVIIAFAGPKATGMPEMFYTTEALCSCPHLIATTAIITDGRFSGASKGPCIGHVSPEAAEGGNIGLLQDGDMVRIDIAGRRLEAPFVDFDARRRGVDLAKVTEAAPAAQPKSKGFLAIYKKLATNAMKGGYME